MSAGELLLSFPMFALARDAAPNPRTGMIHYRGFHARQVNIDGRPHDCLMLFATEDSAREYAARRPALAGVHCVNIADKLELETVLADCRQMGVGFVMIATGMPEQGIARIGELSCGLDKLD
jgi:hypothetical protein